MERAMATFRCIGLAMLFAVLPAACASSRPEPVHVASETGHGEDDPIEVRLGPHRLRLARELFRYGLEPESHRRFELALWLPGDDPMKAEAAMGDLAQAAKLEVDVLHLDGLSEAHLVSFWLREEPPGPSPDPLGGVTPRTRGAPIHGLQPYYLNTGVAPRGDVRDRYLGEEPGRAVPAYIECTPRAIDDGVFFAAGRPQRRAGAYAEVLAVCDHHFAIEGTGIAVSMRYARAALPEWRDIESRVSRLLRRAMVPPIAR